MATTANMRPPVPRRRCDIAVADFLAKPGSRVTEGVAGENAKAVGTDGIGDMIVRWQPNWWTGSGERAVYIALVC